MVSAKTIIFIIVIAAFDLPRTIIDVFGISVRYYFGGNPPWLLPICLLLLLNNMVFKGRSRIYLPKTEDGIFLIIMFGWFLMHIIHQDYSGSSGYEFYTTFYLITTNIWMYIFYYLLKSYDRIMPIRKQLIDAIVYVTVIVSLFYLFINILAFYNLMPYAQVENRNGIAVKATFGLFLLLFHWKSVNPDKKSWEYNAFIILFVLVGLLASSRGPTLTALILIMYKLYFTKKSLLRIISTIFISLGALGIIFVEYDTFQLFLKGITAGFGGEETFYVRKDIINFEDDYVSAYSRNQTNYLMLNSFLNNPLIGIGYSDTLKIRVFGYISHTYYLYPLTSYGLIGVLPYLAFLLRKMKKSHRIFPETTIPTALLIFGVFTFLNDMVAWMAFLLYLMRDPGYNMYDASKFKGRLVSSDPVLIAGSYYYIS